MEKISEPGLKGSVLLVASDRTTSTPKPAFDQYLSSNPPAVFDESL